jgi:hypothetical protein
MKPSIEWAAGLLDGEGCFSIAWQQKTGQISGQLRCVMTHRPTLDRLALSLETGRVRSWARRAPRITAWCWYCPTAELPRVLALLLPHLETKREEARLLQLFVHFRSIRLLAEALWVQMGTFKCRGAHRRGLHV